MKHWTLAQDDNVATLTLDVQGKGANALSQEVMQELDHYLKEIESQPLAGLILRSGKRQGFIVGADVYEFQSIPDAARAAELIRAGQRVLDRLEHLPFPSVALIHGTCLGGGLELALACTYRIAEEGEKTRLGLPEVKLGIHPGFAGTVRLPALIGHLPALDLMLSARTLGARAAKRVGLVDEVVPERYLRRAAEQFLRARPKRVRPAWWKRAPGAAFLRPYVRKLMERQVRKKANPAHYPAPYRVLDLWERAASAEQEALSCAELIVSRVSRNLVYVFLLGEDLKRAGRETLHGIERVHVIGAGVMGADIALWAAYRGFQVSLQDRHAEPLAHALKKAHGFFSKRLKSPRLVAAAMDRLMPDLDGNGLTRADLVIEAIVENADAKSALFAEVEARVRPETLLATNTSSIPLEIVARALKNPARLVGLHFFNPVTHMQLVEIVRGAQSSEDALARARAFTVALERLPLEVKSSPGFLVNRILMPYLMEAMQMLEEGVPMTQIDRAATDFGMPMGPILLADTVGLDICLSVAEFLSKPLGITVPAHLREMVEQGLLGKKSGKGFYTFDRAGKPLPVAQQNGARVMVMERLIMRLLNEGAACLREGVVTRPEAVDAGMVYGTGFAPFEGGPMRYAQHLGVENVTQTLARLAQEYGARFEPDRGWRPAAAAKEALVR